MVVVFAGSDSCPVILAKSYAFKVILFNLRYCLCEILLVNCAIQIARLFNYFQL